MFCINIVIVIYFLLGFSWLLFFFVMLQVKHQGHYVQEAVSQRANV